MRFIKAKAIFEMIIIILSIFTIYLVAEAKDVVAQDSGCCEKLLNGDYCVPETQAQCDQTNGKLFVPGASCADASICQMGTCFIDGQCSANYPKAKCTNLGGEWSDKPMNQVPECSYGCCIVGNNCQFSLKSRCEELTPSTIPINYITGISTEQACTNECIKADKGCCVYGEDEKIYSFVTRDECSNLEGDFRLNTICSSVPGSTCTPKDHTGCLESDPYHVYNYDSCDNIEDPVQPACNYPDEICAKDTSSDKENFVCKSSSCGPTTYDNPNVEGDGGSRLNGEAWCEVQSSTINLPGSIQYKHYCENGVEYAVNCGNERNEMCTGGRYTDTDELPDTNPLHDLPDMNFASCQLNRAKDCAEQTKIDDCKDTTLRDCVWLNDTKDHGKKMCIPMVSPGFTRLDRASGTVEDLCKKGNFNIDVQWWGHYVDDTTSWHCDKNCEAFGNNVLKGTNLFCMMQGDCGASPNVAGAYSGEGYYRNKASGTPSGGRVEQESCKQKINDITLWNTLYETTFNLAGKGLNFGDVKAKDFWQAYGETAESSLGMGLGFTAGGLAGLAAGIFIVSISATGVGLIILLVVALVDLGLTLLFGELKKVETLKIKCKPWEVPAGGDDCGKCSTGQPDGLLPVNESESIIEGYMCQPYTCETLGTVCQYIPDALEGPVCIKADCRDVKPPIIIKDDKFLVSGNQDCCTANSEQRICSTTDCTIPNDIPNKGYTIQGNVNEFKTFTFGIKTIDDTGAPLYSKCAYSNSPSTATPGESAMDSMSDLSGGAAATEHNITILAGDLASSDEKELSFYLRCKTAYEDACAAPVESSVDYIIKLNLHTGPDTTTPIIEYIKPDPAYLAYDKSEKDIIVGVSESLTYNSVLGRSGECRWSDQNVGYDMMSPQNTTSCSGSSMYEAQECSGKLTGVQSGARTYYFACIDPSGNNMTQPEPYIITRTSSLNITSFQAVSSDCIYGAITDCYTNNLSLKLETTGGAEAGKSSCSWSQSQSTTGIPFFKTDSSVHEQPNLNFDTTGDYTYYATCKDIAENEAKSSVTFKINIDNTAPVLIGISHDLSYNKLKITISDANAVNCRYSNKEFYLPEGKSMDSIGNGHFADWGLGIYYIRCEDKFGNEMPLSIIHTSSL